jgi:hypothetical protein
MGPFPHDAPAATISADNPMGTDGFSSSNTRIPTRKRCTRCSS